MCEHLWIAKDLWNTILEANKKRYAETRKFITKGEILKMTKSSGLYAQTAQRIAYRLHAALWRMVKLRTRGKECGFPRFKSIDRMKSLNYPQFGFSLNKKLKVTPFGMIAIKQHREIEGKIKTLTLKRESSGKWFATFCVETEPKEPRKNLGGSVGIDLGLKNFATLSDGKLIPNPRHLKAHEARLAFKQRLLSRAKKGSANRRKARIIVAKEYEKVANTRTDFLHKLSTSLVNSHSFIALEQLASQEMAGQNYGKQINDAGWSTFADMMRYKAESAGCEVVFVDPKNTTKECSNCGGIQDMPLSERMYCCPVCGATMDRDVNAAINILKRATVGQTESNASGIGTLVPTVKEEPETHDRRGRMSLRPDCGEVLGG